MNKLVRGYLSQTLEAGNLRVWSEISYRLLPLLIAVAVTGLLLVAYPEEGCLKDIYMSLSDEVREELEEESQQEQPDVHSVNIASVAMTT